MNSIIISRIIKQPFHLLFAVVLCCIACNNDESKLQKLSGHWKLANAEDNESPAKDRLEGIFFDFTPTGSFSTNFSPTGDALSGSFLLSGNKVTLQTVEPMTFNIDALQDSMLQLNTTLQGHVFKIWLSK